MTQTPLDTGFLGTAEGISDSSALIAGAVLAHAHQDEEGLSLYRVCTPEELMVSACLAVTEIALSVCNDDKNLATDRLYEAVHRDSGDVGPEEHLLAIRLLRATARAVDSNGTIYIQMEDFNEVDHLQASIEAFRRASAACGQFPAAASLTIRNQAPLALRA